MANEKASISKLVEQIRSGNPVLSDHDLLQKYAHERDENAFAELVNRHSAMVYQRCHRTLRDTGLAEEVTQAVFIMMERKAKHISREVVLAGWLHKAAKFASIDALRSVRRQHQLGETMKQRIEDIQQHNREREVWREMMPHVDEALDKLRDKYRSAVLLRYFENKSLREVAQVMGISENVAKNCIYRGIKGLKRYMDRRKIAFSGMALPSILEQAHLDTTTGVSIGHKVMGAIKAGSTGSAQLATQGLKAMAFAKLQAIAATVLLSLSGGLAMTAYATQESGMNMQAVQTAKTTRKATKDELDQAKIDYELGLSKQKNKAYEAAIHQFNHVMREWSFTPYASKSLYQRSICNEHLQIIDKAMAGYIEYIKSYPKGEFAGFSYVRMGNYHFRSKAYDKASEIFIKFFRSYPKHKLAGKTLFLAGQAYIKQKKYDAAAEILTELADSDPSGKLRMEALYWLGESHFKLKNYTQSYREFKKLTWDYPSGKWAKIARGRLKDENFSQIVKGDGEKIPKSGRAYDREFRDEVAGEAKQLGVLKPWKKFPGENEVESDKKHYLSGLNHCIKYDYDKAIASFEKVIQGWPASDWCVKAWLKKGRCLIILKKSKQAIQSFREFENRFHDRREAHARSLWYQGAAWEQLEDWEEARVTYEKITRLYEGSTWYFKATTKVLNAHLHVKKEYKQVLDIIDGILNKYPDHPGSGGLMLKAVVANYRLGEYQAAKDWNEKIINGPYEQKVKAKAIKFTRVIKRKLGG